MKEQNEKQAIEEMACIICGNKKYALAKVWKNALFIQKCGGMPITHIEKATASRACGSGR